MSASPNAPPATGRPDSARSVLARAAAGAALAAATAGAAGCGADRVANPSGPPAPRYAQVWVWGDTGPLSEDSVPRGLGRTLNVRARAVGDAGGVVLVDSATWSVGDTSVLALSAGDRGLTATVRGRREGTTTVTVQVAGLRAEARVLVLRPAVTELYVTSTGGTLPTAPDSLVVRARQTFGVRVQSTDGPVTDRVPRWRTADTTVAAVDADGTVTALALGTTTLVAEVEGFARNHTVVVRPPLAARLAFTYAPDTLLLRRADSVRAVLYDSSGAASPVAVRLSVPAWGAASAVTGGRVGGVRVGRAELVASGDGLEVRRPLTVLPQPQAPPAAYPAAVAVTPGTTVALAARAVDVDGYDVAEPLSFGGGDAAVATVGESGAVRAQGVGTTTVRVRSGGTHTDVPVTVVAPGAFSLTVRSANPARALPPTLAEALATATAAWERAVIGDLPDERFTFSAASASACDAPEAAGEQAVDDVLVFASADSLDGPGGILAQAGPCLVRDDGTTVVGRVMVDVVDIDRLGAGTLAAVLRHELGHVLGIGTLWTRASRGLVVRGGTGWRYVGRRGMGVATWWNRVGRDALGVPTGVPLGEARGGGVGHWDESAFSNELMTPVIDPGVNPLSLLTLEALAELGYLTSAAAAEQYGRYPSATAAPGAPAPSRGAAGAAGGAPGADGVPFETVLQPRLRVDAGGRVRALPPPAPPR